MAFHVFHRTWWKENPEWPNGLEPSAGVRYHIEFVDQESEAQAICRQYNDTHDKGRLSNMAEYEEV